MESAARSGVEIAGEAVNKLGKYSYSNIKKNKERLQDKDVSRKPIDCYNCGNRVSESIIKHKEHCLAKNVKCHKCGKFNHFAEVCRSQKDIRHVDESKEIKAVTSCSTHKIDQQGQMVKILKYDNPDHITKL